MNDWYNFETCSASYTPNKNPLTLLTSVDNILLDFGLLPAKIQLSRERIIEWHVCRYKSYTAFQWLTLNDIIPIQIWVVIYIITWCAIMRYQNLLHSQQTTMGRRMPCHPSFCPCVRPSADDMLFGSISRFLLNYKRISTCAHILRITGTHLMLTPECVRTESHTVIYI